MTKLGKIIVGLVVLVVIIVVGVSFVTKGSTSRQDVGGTQELIKIGANFALSSFGASWGEPSKQGAELAAFQINQNGGVLGRQVVVVTEDNYSEAKGSVSAVNKLISIDKVNFLLTGWTDQTEPVIPIITQNKILTVTVSAGAADFTKKSEYLYRTWPSDAIAVKELVAYAKSKNFKKVALVQSIGPWENSLIEVFTSLAKEQGIKVVSPVSFPIDTQDFKTHVSKIKQSKPDAVFAAITSGPIERFLQQSGELKIGTPILYPVDVAALGATAKVSVPYLKNLIYAIYTPSRQVFVDAFKAKYGTEPGPGADTAYDAVYMIARAVEKAGTTDVEKVKTAFTPFDGASGTITFNEFRDRSDAQVILMGFDGATSTPMKIK
ncbi:MAG: ABC transporter substrate-binding protein [Candidatus Taylorbacteria bacterium]|nr:ABC transporter substrate-binding protein [Candidatus Taylorbacteria bacterium]